MYKRLDLIYFKTKIDTTILFIVTNKEYKHIVILCSFYSYYEAISKVPSTPQRRKSLYSNSVNISLL